MVGVVVGVGVAVAEGFAVGVGVVIAWALTVIEVVVIFISGKALFEMVIVWVPAVLRVMLKTPMPCTRFRVMPSSGYTAWLSVELKSTDCPYPCEPKSVKTLAEPSTAVTVTLTDSPTVIVFG